jgi:nucleoside-diphosphate-sugar epimerase
MVKRRVLITGGAGYLGSVLTGHLLDKGYKVTCLDNLMYRQNTPFLFVNNPDFNFIYGDSRDKSLLNNVLSKSDTIIPLAALVGMPLCDKRPLDAKSTNKDSIVMLNKLRSPDQKVIFPTTNSGYGTKSGEIYCTEETLLEPISLYGKTKVDAEKCLLESNKNVITLRLATVFGTSPRMRTDLLVNDFVLKAVRDKYLVIYEGHAKRNYIHIKDVAKAFEHCIKHYSSMRNEAYNVGLSSANISKLDLSKKIKEHIPKFEIICQEIGEDPDKRNYIVSNEKIEKTGFRPNFSLDDGIKELTKGYKILLKNNPYGNA